MKKRFWLLALMMMVAPWMSAAEAPVLPAVKGRVVALTLHSVVLGRDVPLHVWLPPGYDDAASAATKYPVMYMLDGAEMFDAVAGEKKSMHLDATLERLTTEGKIGPIIVVAIDQPTTPEERGREYIPYRDPYNAPDGVAPHGNLLPEFLIAEVLPKISAGFRVTDDAGKTGIGGLSYSGAAALYVLIQRPAMFGLALIESPSLQVGNGQLLRDTINLTGAGRRVAIGVGTRELGQNEDELAFGFRKGDINRAAVHMNEILAAHLRAAAVPPEVQLTIEEGAEHKGEAWAGRYAKDFVFLFGKRP